MRMERELGKIEQVIATETKRRIEASKALQVMFEAKLAAMQAQFKKELRAAFEPLQASVDAALRASAAPDVGEAPIGREELRQRWLSAHEGLT